MTTNSFWNHAQSNPDYVALIEPDGTEHKSGDLLSAVNQVVHGLRARGVQKGDAVATVLPNSIQMVEVALAAGQVGWYVTPINHHLTAAEVEFILQDSGAKALVCGAAYAETCQEALKASDVPAENVFVVGEDARFRAYDELKRGQPTDMPEGRTGGFAMTYTSGTTGRPRGVRRPTMDIDPDVLADNFAGFLQLFGIKKEGVHLTVSPLYHTAVLNFSLYSLHFGHTVVLMDKWTPEGMLERVEKHKVTTTHIVPTQLIRLLTLSEEERAKYDVSSFQHLIHSAAPCPIDVKRMILDWFGPVVYEYYAASEGGGTLATPQDWLKKPGTVGNPWPISTVEIRDDQGNALPASEVGTVWMRMGEHTFKYHGDEEKTKNAWKEDFFTVGDAGYLDEDGYLFLCDRKADMIISGGVNIYPAEIECELVGHPKVEDCAVFGIPDDDWGEQVKAVIQLPEGEASGPAVEAEILEWCQTRMAKYKCPRSIDFTTEMPRDPNGKLYKRKLRDPYWEGRTRAI